MSFPFFVPSLDQMLIVENLSQNFRLTKTFTVKVEKTYLTFVGFEGVDLRMYRVRVKTYEMAADLGKALEKAVAELE